MTFPFPTFLPASSAPAALTSFTKVLDASGSSGTVTVPSGVQAGDLIALVQLDSASESFTMPSGFSLLAVGTGTQKFHFSVKVADGSEGGTSYTDSPSTSIFKIVLVFRGDVPLASISGGTGTVGSVTNGNPGAINITSGTPPVLYLAAYVSTGAVDPRTFTPTKDGEYKHTGLNFWSAWRADLSSTSGISVDMDDEGNVNQIGAARVNLAI